MTVYWRAESFGRANRGRIRSVSSRGVTSGSFAGDFNSTISDERCAIRVPIVNAKGSISLQKGSLEVRNLLAAFGVLYLQPGVCSAWAGRIRSENERV